MNEDRDHMHCHDCDKKSPVYTSHTAFLTSVEGSKQVERRRRHKQTRMYADVITSDDDQDDDHEEEVPSSFFSKDAPPVSAYFVQPHCSSHGKNAKKHVLERPPRDRIKTPTVEIYA
jgi:hypothetical protein